MTKEIAKSGMPDFSNILGADISVGQKRRSILLGMGLRKPKQKYASKEARKEAAKKRHEEKKKSELVIFKKYGIEPKKKVKMTPAQRKSRPLDTEWKTSKVKAAA